MRLMMMMIYMYRVPIQIKSVCRAMMARAGSEASDLPRIKRLLVSQTSSKISKRSVNSCAQALNSVRVGTRNALLFSFFLCSRWSAGCWVVVMTELKAKEKANAEVDSKLATVRATHACYRKEEAGGSAERASAVSSLGWISAHLKRAINRCFGRAAGRGGANNSNERTSQ